MIDAAKGADPEWLEAYFENMSVIVGCIKLHIRPYVDPILTSMVSAWDEHLQIREAALKLIECVVRSMGAEIRPFVRRLVPHLMSFLSTGARRQKRLTQRILKVVAALENGAEELMHLIVPCLTALLVEPSVHKDVKMDTLRTLRHLMYSVPCRPFASCAAHRLADVLSADGDQEYISSTLVTLSVLAYRLRADFIPFVSMVNTVCGRLHAPIGCEPAGRCVLVSSA